MKGLTICYTSAAPAGRERRRLNCEDGLRTSRRVPVSSHRHGSGKTNRVQAMQVDEILLIDDDVELCSMLIEYLGRSASG